MGTIGLGVYKNDECKPACLAALKHGYRHIDSARIYRNEAVVGEAVKESGIPRSEIFITTKILSSDGGYESTIAAVDQSLDKFKFEYIDLYLIHEPLAGKEKRLQTYRALLECQKAGKIRTVGVSNFAVKHLEELKEAGMIKPAVNQLELHPFCQQKEIVEYCQKNGIIVQAYCPLVRGKFDDPVLQRTAKKHSKDVAQVLVRWSLQRGFIPLPKSAQPSRIISNAEVYDFELDSEDMSAIDALDQGKAGEISWNPVGAD
ncbi:hypothetical protein M422DRAFT_77224 [Sphaerobolus stellatus SS14]|uniref:NADP-dependent oxidoreductase domain-containing protein n=1 Tax=Sphaerobolus stellatus (strain SS14) TaxID=990650 RepID=A0A0C9T419_SPHS4|nr:hypothetical protein M422DRAFT_77224 [Sphaerobolus stellatus SS14]